MIGSEMLAILLDLLQIRPATGAAALVAGGLHMGGASVVTIHVLLRKRDVGAAISWIGLAWLSPMLGPLLYMMFGINRVARRAQRLRRTVPRRRFRFEKAAEIQDPLRNAGDRITGHQLTEGNRVGVLSNGDEAYPAMLAAIRSAQTSIAMSTYIFRDDETGRRFVDALAEAHGRGVAVRVLIDGVGGGYFRSAIFCKLRKAGVTAARFHHVRLPWRMPFLNMRNHKKILLVDGRAAFTGGMNIGDDNLVGPRSCPCRRQDPSPVVRDTHFQIEGPVAAQLAEAFAEDWRMATGERLAGPEWFPPIPAAGEAAARAVPSGPDEDVNQLELLLLAAIAEARESIRIATPYFVPPERLISALRVAALRGVAIDIVLPRRADHRMMDWAARAHIRPLLSVGCRLWYAPDPFNHSKLMSVDGTWSLLGSANWDTRSLRLNFELNVEIRDPAFAQAMERMIFASREREVTGPELDAQHLAIRVRNAAARLLLPYI